MEMAAENEEWHKMTQRLMTLDGWTGSRVRGDSKGDGNASCTHDGHPFASFCFQDKTMGNKNDKIVISIKLTRRGRRNKADKRHRKKKRKTKMPLIISDPAASQQSGQTSRDYASIRYWKNKRKNKFPIFKLRRSDPARVRERKSEKEKNRLVKIIWRDLVRLDSEGPGLV